MLLFFSVGSCLVNIALSSVLINLATSYGAALSNLLSQSILALSVTFYSKRISDIDFGLKIMIKQIMISIFVILIGLCFNYLYVVEAFCLWNLAYKIIMSLIGFFFIIFINRKRFKKMMFVQKG